MSDQEIIDTIAGELLDWRGYRKGTEAEVAEAIFDALRTAGYVITKPQPFVVTREMLEDQPDLLLQIQARQMDSALRAAADLTDEETQ